MSTATFDRLPIGTTSAFLHRSYEGVVRQADGPGPIILEARKGRS